jgi:hypothetical protein
VTDDLFESRDKLWLCQRLPKVATCAAAVFALLCRVRPLHAMRMKSCLLRLMRWAAQVARSVFRAVFPSPVPILATGTKIICCCCCTHEECSSDGTLVTSNDSEGCPNCPVCVVNDVADVAAEDLIASDDLEEDDTN